MIPPCYITSDLKKNRKNLTIIAEKLATKVEGENLQAVHIAKAMAQAQSTGMFGDRENTTEYAKQILLTTPEFTGAYFAYEPQLNDTQYASLSKSHSLSAAVDKTGRFLPYWFRDANGLSQVKLEPLIDMDSSLYYQGTKNLFLANRKATPMITEPYDYAGKLLVEQTFPIIIDDKFVGIAGVDRALNDLLLVLESESNRYGVDIFLISNQGRFVSTTTKQNSALRTKLVSQTQYADLMAMPVFNHAAEWFVQQSDPFDDESYFYTSSQIPTGNWLVILRKPEQIIVGAMWRNALLLLLISSVVLLIIAFLIKRVLGKATARINQTVKAARLLAKGETPPNEMLDVAGNDEVYQLSNAFNEVVNYYQAVEHSCQKIAQGNFNVHLAPKGQHDLLASSINLLAEKRQAAEEAMVQAQKMAENANESKSHFLANMSHEIRTPINAMMGLSRLCLSTEMSAQQRDYLEKIHSSGRSLLTIINDILDFSKIEAGKLELDNIDFTLESLFESLSSMTMPSAHQKGLELLFDVPYSPQIFIGDPQRLGQILLNLVSNAIKFTESGEVAVKVRINKLVKNNCQLNFSVIDQGIGISDEQQLKLFHSFTQAESSITREFGGTGLGLVICKNLVELMGGEIKLESALGVGTSMHFSVNLHLSDTTKAAEPKLPASLLSSSVLVVDDSKLARQIMRNQLDRLGIKNETVGSGFEALNELERKAKKEPYRIVLMDWKMPGMDGLQTAQLIRSSQGQSPTTTIMMITAYYSDESERLFKQQGLKHFLKKPISDAELRNMLLRCLNEGNELSVQSAEKWQLKVDEQLKGAKVLLVEDNKLNQQLAKELLNIAGMAVDVANNGREGVKLATDNHYDAILMDLQMPIMGGIEATEIIRATEVEKALPIIAMTANTMAQHKQACFAAGMNDHVSKPIEADALYSTLKKWIQVPQITSTEEHTALVQNTTIDIEPIANLRIDSQLALKYSHGNEDKMMSLAKIFLDTHENDLHHLKSALSSSNEKDKEHALQIAHSISGVAIFVGARQLEQKSQAYEYADTPLLSGYRDGLLNVLTLELEAVLNDLSQLVNH